MNLPQIINNLYTNRQTDWIIKLDNELIQPFVIQRWLSMDDGIRDKVRWLDKYVYTLQANPKMYLSLAWSLIKKANRKPYVKYIKKMVKEDEYFFILSLVRKHFKMSDNDYNAVKSRLIDAITRTPQAMSDWFAYYGVRKAMWKKYYLDYNYIKTFGEKEDNSQKGLGAWGV